jgi:NDP-sugar pyrophosphorylase family protein
MKALILLGGLGTRLRPLTCDIPKPLIPLLNRPALVYQLELIKRSRIKEVIFCTGYLSDSFRDYFSGGKNFGIKIRHMYEKTPLGTGGAIKNVQKLIDEPTVIFNGDILTDIDLDAMIDFHQRKKAFVTISLVRVKDPTVYGLVEMDKTDRVERFLEKPSWDEVTCNTINAGTYIFEPEVLDYIPEGVNHSVERGLFPLLLEKNKRVYGFVSKDYWLDIGTVDKYLQAHHDILRGELKHTLYAKPGGRKIFAGRGVKINPLASVSGRVVLGDDTKVEEFAALSGLVSVGRNCVIRKGAQVVDSVILDNTVIGEGVRMERAVIGQNCRIDSNVSLVRGSVLGHGSHITRYSSL